VKFFFSSSAQGHGLVGSSRGFWPSEEKGKELGKGKKKEKTKER
jgi:hypothetical protein